MEQQQTHTKDHFYVTLVLLAFLFAYNAMWWESEQLSYEYEDSMAATITSQLVRPAKDDAQISAELETLEADGMDAELDAIDKELESL